MNFKEMFSHTKEKGPDIKVEEKEEVSVEAEKGTEALEEMGEKMNFKLDTESLIKSINDNPEAIVSKAEKNEELKKKLKTFIGVTGLLVGGSAMAYSFSNPDEMSLALRELSRVIGLSTAGASAVYMSLEEKIRNMKVPDVVARFFEGK